MFYPTHLLDPSARSINTTWQVGEPLSPEVPKQCIINYGASLYYFGTVGAKNNYTFKMWELQ